MGAVIVVVLGLLTANYFSRQGQISTGIQTPSEIQIQETQKNTRQQEYKVQKGDNLSQISEKFYGTQENWPVLANINNIQNPDLIFADASIKIPPKQEVETLKPQVLATKYQVQAGDTLFGIAQKVYGDGDKWHLLDQANKVGRLPNGNPLIFSGNPLVIPR